MHPCIICLNDGGDPWNGGICCTCLTPLKPYKSRRRVKLKLKVHTVEVDDYSHWP
jgi:hypothetical protein